MDSDLGAFSKELNEQLLEYRRYFHRNPELGFSEYKTSAYLREVLQNLNLEVKSGIAGTGVTALLEGTSPGPTIALRADMDALPIQEQTELDFASENPGVMHACGHDAHMAMVLGAAHLLKKAQKELPGKVKFIFQPCEETPPGGALALIEEGVLKNPDVDAILGAHVSPELNAGTIGLKHGITMAAADMFEIIITGEGGHGSSPHLTRDPIAVAAEAVLALQQIISRRVNPLEAAVISIGSIQAGEKANVIPDAVVLRGTTRSLNPDLRKWLAKEIKKVLQGVCEAHGVDFEIDYQWGYPPVVNNRGMTELLEKAAVQELGSPQKIVKLHQPSMGGEDFAYYSKIIPAAYFYVGVASEDKRNFYPWHHSRFDIEENALLVGARVMAAAVKTYLEQAKTEK